VTRLISPAAEEREGVHQGSSEYLVADIFNFKVSTLIPLDLQSVERNKSTEFKRSSFGDQFFRKFPA
jgi:hypothetical protein